MNALHVDDYLGDLAHGKLERPLERRVRAHVAGCLRCRRSLRHLRNVVSRMPVTLLGREPPPHLLAKHLCEAHGPSRFQELVEPLAELFGLPLTQAQVVLGRADVASEWTREAGGLELLRVLGGGGRASSACLLVRIPFGLAYPLHLHEGDETTLVLQGGCEDSDGDEAFRGDLVFKPQGSSHSLRVLEGPACIAAVCVDAPR